jgi:chaperone required for assembly of F1-ATPase
MIRDLLADLAGAPDPMRAARQARKPLPKRFYKAASVATAAGGHAVLLDGKAVKTPAKKSLVLPTRALAEAVAAEWAAQEAEIDPARMPLTRLVNVAIDRVAADPAAVADEIARYAGSDLLCYRAADPPGLVVLQGQHWDPIANWAREALGARFVFTEGVTHVAQPEAALAAVRRAIDAHAPPLKLAALASLTALSGSVLIALSLAQGAITSNAAWAAAQVDEDWNIQKWGDDAEAAARRAGRRTEFDAAVRLLTLV